MTSNPIYKKSVLFVVDWAYCEKGTEDYGDDENNISLFGKLIIHIFAFFT